jgi:hypothetical protein
VTVLAIVVVGADITVSSILCGIFLWSASLRGFGLFGFLFGRCVSDERTF